MRHSFLVLITGVCALVSGPLVASSDAALIDASFEAGDGPTFVGWTTFGNTFNDPVANPHTGVRVAKMFGAGDNSFSGAFQDQPATAGEIVTASVWARTETGDQLSGTASAVLKMEWVGAVGGIEATILTAGSIADVWTEYVLPSQLAPVGTTATRITLIYSAGAGPTGGSVLFDDANLSVVPEPTTLGILGLTTMGLALRRRRRVL